MSFLRPIFISKFLGVARAQDHAVGAVVHADNAGLERIGQVFKVGHPPGPVSSSALILALSLLTGCLGQGDVVADDGGRQGVAEMLINSLAGVSRLSFLCPWERVSRMPVILRPGPHSAWLSSTTAGEFALAGNTLFSLV